MRRVRTAFAGCVILLTASLLLARVHPFGDAGLYAANGAGAGLMDHTAVPPGVRTILAAKCADCHSLRVRTPIYGRFAPVSWLMERDIMRGRTAMNLSVWASYSTAQQQTLAAKIVQETREHEMPLPQYRMIHWDSGVTDDDARALAGWARATSALGTDSASNTKSDPVRGKELFEKRCTGCHALTQNHEGPHLGGVYGRTSGTAAGFTYSAALKKAQIVWDDQSLDRWLADPDAFIPGNNMDFLVARPQDRRDIIEYLRQVSGK